MNEWTPETWKRLPIAQDVPYEDTSAAEAVASRMRTLPPLVTSWEIENLRTLVAEAQQGKRFLLQGGDCAETLADCQPSIIANKLKILLQMSLVLILGAAKPVVRVGRFAGQYAKPRSSPFETRNGVTLPSYFGDLVNRPEFTAEARRPDPNMLLTCYQHAALTLNFIRSLTTRGFADLHHPEYWDLSFFERADLSDTLRAEYQRTIARLDESLRFMEAFGDGHIGPLSQVDFYTSHEALNLHYEAALTRTVPRNHGYYNLSTHLPWLGERTRSLDGAHVEYFRGIRNPIGVKIGPKAAPAEVLGLISALNPQDEAGRLVLIHRMGAKVIRNALPPIVDAVARAGKRVLWVCDPMHGNTVTTSTGLKTRDAEEIFREVEGAFDVHASCGTYLGGLHFELTGEDVTECLGSGVGEADLSRAYDTACDPRLNYAQAMEMAFSVTRRLRKSR